MIEIRRLTELDQFREAVALQKEIWGFADIDLLPVRLFVVSQKVGGHSFGAHDVSKGAPGEMVGFLLAIPGLHGTRGYLHSHMMGVRSDYRNAGLGRKLKLAQRDEAISRGLDLVEWTFDPLELKNAFFNIERLGAIVPRYSLNQYGTTSSKLHGGLPTDRCIAQWWISSVRVEAILAGKGADRSGIEARVAVPNDIADIRASDPHRAREIQARISAEFVENTEKGLAVMGFERTDANGVYLFSPWPSK